MTSPSKALLIAFTLAIPLSARPLWYAQGGPDGRVRACAQAEDRIDEVLAHANQGWSKASGGKGSACAYRAQGGEALIGYMIDCREGGEHMFFRTRDDCERFRTTVNSGAAIEPEQYVPKGTKNRAGWMSALTACVHTMAKPATLEKAGLGNVVALCECQAKKCGMEAEVTPEVASEAFMACLREAPPTVRANLILGYQGAKGDPPPASSKPSR
ncbi:MAG: hypothetical protein QM704_14800 [Anaeromyxobacteraceae bacterium]